jgi:YD repeat-containing protein
VLADDHTLFRTGLRTLLESRGDFAVIGEASDGTVWGCRYNGYGGLGNGTSGNTSSTPAQTVGPGGSGYLTGITAVAASADHSIAVKSDGTTWTWGYNSNGQLGSGTTTNSSTPIPVSGLMGITSVAGGGWHSVANARVQPNPTATTTYGYDRLDRLTSVNNGATAYTYDPVGNRLTPFPSPSKAMERGGRPSGRGEAMFQCAHGPL